MNRLKKEEMRKYNEARKGLTREQIAVLDKKEEQDNKIKKLARQLHAERFPEEYDFMYDSIADAKDRKKGINPMRQEYIDEVNKKRNRLGVSPLSESGMPTSDDTMVLCLEEARKTIS